VSELRRPGADARQSGELGVHGLFEPYVLLLLSENPAPTHGYDLRDRLIRWGIAATRHQVDLYGLLHRLQRKGLIHAQWQTSDDGVRRRMYMLTTAGWEMLPQWEQALERDRQAIELFLQRVRAPVENA